eukprot:521375-Pelagomonas_calceolata.AAC.1
MAGHFIRSTSWGVRGAGAGVQKIAPRTSNLAGEMACMCLSSEHTLRRADQSLIFWSNAQLSLLARSHSLLTWAPKLGRHT